MAFIPEELRVFLPLRPEDLPLVPLDAKEEEVFDKCFRAVVEYYKRVLPEVADIIDKQRDLVHLAARLFKGKIGIEAKKLVGFTPQPGMIGIQPLAPKDIRYVKTATATDPAYSQYELNSWDLKVTAGTTKWLLGDGTNYYRSKPTVNQRALIVILKDCLVEIGTTPSFNQFIVKAETKPYTPWVVHEFIDVTIQKNLTAYIYNTPGALLCMHDYGMMLGSMPVRTGTSNLRLVGFVFYETDYFKDLTWIS